MSDRRAINTSSTLPRVSNNTPRHARSSIKKLRVPARHSLTTITHRPLTHTKRAPQHRISRVRHTAITKQRIHKNRRLIVTTTCHVTSGSRYALTRSLHTVHKLTKERPHAPQRPGPRVTAVSYRHRLPNPLSRHQAPHSPKPPTQGSQRHSHAHATKSAHTQQRVNFYILTNNIHKHPQNAKTTRRKKQTSGKGKQPTHEKSPTAHRDRKPHPT